MAARAVGTAGRVLAVEPAGATYARLTENVSLNNLANVTCRKLAVAGEAGEARLHVSNNALFSSLYSRVDGHGDKAEVETVTALTLRQLMELEGLSRIDMLKMDCEGAEHDIVAGLDEETASKIMQISLEIHSVDGKDTAVTIGQLERLGYRVRQGETYFCSRS